MSDLINKIVIGLGLVLEIVGCIGVGFNVYEYGTVDETLIIGLVCFGMWMVISGLLVYAARHDMDISFSIPVHIVNDKD